MNFTGAAAVVCSAIAFAVVHRRLTGRSWAARVMVAGILALPSVPSLLSAIYYFHVLPERAGFYTLRSWTGSEFFVIFLGATGGALASMLSRRLLVLPLLFTLLVAVVPYVKPLVNPLKTGFLQDRWKDGVCLQSAESTCGPASTATILKSLEIDASEREIAAAAFTSGGGTEAWYLARYCRSRGLAVQFDFRPDFSPSVGFPSMVGVRIGSFGHFIAVLDVSEGLVTYADPLSGKSRVSLEEFHRRYTFTGFHMVVSKF